MKAKFFTLILCVLLVGNSQLFAQDDGTGIEWGSTFSSSEPIVLDENFQGFDFFHSDSNPNDGNSDNTFDPNNSEVIIPGYKSDTVEVAIPNTKSGKISYYFDECAFAPDWGVAYSWDKDAGEPVDPDPTTAGVSKGFVEVSRDYGSTPPTVAGYFIVDLSELEYVDGIQWSHSSTGGNKRGVMLEFSKDEGATWDTLRYQPGSAYTASFTKDVNSGVKTMNTIRCQPSAYGMTWEEGIYYAGKLMLRFSEAGGQTPRIHDLKVYGTYTPPTSSVDIKAEDLKVYNFNKEIRISQEVTVTVYNIGGVMVKSALKANSVSMSDMPNGIYIVKAQVGSFVKTAKVLIK